MTRHTLLVFLDGGGLINMIFDLLLDDRCFGHEKASIVRLAKDANGMDHNQELDHVLKTGFGIRILVTLKVLS
jgi:hypothetical protein